MFKKKDKEKNRIEGSFYDVFQALIRDKRAMIGLSFIVILIFIAIFADVLAPYPNQVGLIFLGLMS